MLDVGVNRLPPIFICGGMELELKNFVNILYRHKTHLKELSVYFQVKMNYFLLNMNYSFL